MKILFPLEVFYPSQAGGPANSVYWLARSLSREGFEPTIVASDKGIAPDFPVNRWQQNEAGQVIHVRTRSFTFPVSQTRHALAKVRDSDAVHLSSLFYPAAFLTATFARLLKKKLFGR